MTLLQTRMPFRFLLVVLALAAAPWRGMATEAGSPRGGRVGWARLVTGHSNWDIHSDQDPKLATFIREETSLNIDPVWYSVDARRLEDLCVYPFIYVKDLSRFRDEAQVNHIKEYLMRGGFLCIDPCIAHFSTGDDTKFIRQHGELLTHWIPGATFEQFPSDHPIYRAYFNVRVEDVYTDDMLARGASRPAQIPMAGVFYENRLIAVMAICGLECGWPQTPQRRPGCSKMMVNIYVHAMTGGPKYGPMPGR